MIAGVLVSVPDTGNHIDKHERTHNLLNRQHTTRFDWTGRNESSTGPYTGFFSTEAKELSPRRAEVRGPRGQERRRGSWGAGSQPLPTS